jgi:glucose-6-phosphate dehydrogenase assembly protein OpcA
LQRRSVRDCLSEELRRLDPDEIYAETLKGLPKVVRGRSAAAARATAARQTAKAQGDAPTPKRPAQRATSGAAPS